VKPALQPRDYDTAAALLDCDAAAVCAVVQVESLGCGFNPDGSPVTLFEGHKFHKFTGGRFDDSHPDLSYPEWTRKWYGHTWQAEQSRLQRALALDRPNALLATSFGAFQIMGFNHALAGHDSLQGFVNAMYRSSRDQLLCFVAFVRHSGLGPALRRHDWATFARGYNGPGYAVNNYGERLAAAHLKFSALVQENLGSGHGGSDD
jgi:N-acetylmuramidase